MQMPMQQPIQPTVTFAPTPVPIIPQQMGHGALGPPMVNNIPQQTMPQNHQQQMQAPVQQASNSEPRYIFLASPDTHHKKNRRSKSRSGHDTSQSDMEEGLRRAHKAIHEMKNLTRKMASKN